jgi:hypothetical protein
MDMAGKNTTPAGVEHDFMIINAINIGTRGVRLIFF